MDRDKEIQEYQQKIKEFKKEKNADLTIHQFSRDMGWNSAKKRQSEQMKRLQFSIDCSITGEQHSKKQGEQDTRQTFTNICWAGGNNIYADQIAAVNNKGHVLLYNSTKLTCLKNINPTNSVLNTCAIEMNENGLLACAGYDGRIYLTNINNASSGTGGEKKDNTDDQTLKFTGHQGVVSCIKFLNYNFMLSASYDSVILLWDVNSQEKPASSYHDHTSEVSGLDVNEQNGNIFATGSGDTYVKLWDIREKKACVCTFKGSNSSVNCVKFLPGTYQTIAAGSEDSFIKLYDLRALKELGNYRKKSDNKSISSVSFSKSGQILFATSANSNEIQMWDVFDEGEPFGHYTYNQPDESGKGIQQLCINSAGDTLAIIVDNKILFLR